MKLPFQTTLTFVLFSFLMVVQYQNCSNYADPSPWDRDVKDLASSSAPSEIRLDSPSGLIDVSHNDYTISMGGSCNTGLTKRHYIEVRLTDTANVPLPVKIAPVDSLCPDGGTGLPDSCFVAKNFKCEHGKYYINVPVNCAAYRGQYSTPYRILGQLVTINENGQEERDPKASFNRFFNIAWGTGACP